MQARFCAAAHVDLDPLRQKGVDLRPGEKTAQGKPVAVGLPCRRGEYVVAARRQAAQQALVGCGQLDQVLGGHDQPLAIMWLGPEPLCKGPAPKALAYAPDGTVGVKWFTGGGKLSCGLSRGRCALVIRGVPRCMSRRRASPPLHLATRRHWCRPWNRPKFWPDHQQADSILYAVGRLHGRAVCHRKLWFGRSAVTGTRFGSAFRCLGLQSWAPGFCPALPS